MNLDQTIYSVQREEEEKQTEEIAKKLNLPYISLTNYPIAPDVLGIIPKENAIQCGIISYIRAGDTVRVATNNPKDENTQKFLNELSVNTKYQFSLSYCSKSSVNYGLAMYQVLLPEMKKTEKVEVTEKAQTDFEKSVETLKDLREKIGKVSTTEMLDLFFAGAVKNNATDIHMEPQEQYFRVRYRIDGVLQDVVQLPLAAYHQVIARIKHLSNLKLDVIHPQDGRLEVTVVGEQMDIRVSTLPTTYGEAVVMRLLPKHKKFTTLESLGFNQNALDVVKEAISKTQGLILNTGPTGSGKTTTLYAILQRINEPGKKIITLENPIEYRIEGIEQIQIDAENTTSFLDALRASLRQDPDIMMVGEVRDNETANIALQASMTGHLVLTTLHTNNAAAAFARLAEIGVPPYLLAGSINLIIAQRLVRMIHKECGGKGCELCHNTGFKGRVAIVETLVPTREIEELIMRKAALREFEEMAIKLGMKTMYQDGLEKVAQGITTLEEVERVTKE